MTQKRTSSLIFILGALSTITPFSIDMYLPAFQQLADEFHTTFARVAFSLSSYFIGIAIGQVIYGPLLDRFGRKPPLIVGLGIYILSTFACLFAPDIDSLIALRFLQAFGACAAQVASMAMVRDFYPPEEGAKVFSRLMLILSVSPLFAPTIGSVIAASYGWKWIFILLALIVVLILLAVIFVLPEGHQPDPSISLDPRLITKEFVAIFRDRQFFTYAVSGAFSFAGLFIYLGGSSALFMGSYHFTAKEFGLVFAFLSVGIIGGGQVNIFLLNKWSSQQIYKFALIGQLITAMIYAVGSFMNFYGVVAHIVIFFIYLSCVGLTFPNAATLALFPFEKNAGSAAALLGFLQMVVGALASAAFSLLALGPSQTLALAFLVSGLLGFIIFKASLLTSHKPSV